jgi:hypothetical protein
MLSRVEVWLAGVQIEADLSYLSGEVTLDGTGGVRGKLNLTLPAGEGTATWDLLSPIGTEVIPYRGVRFIDGTSEWVPLGVFGIDSQRMGYGADGTLSLTAPDRWARVQRARFLSPATTTGGAVTEAIRLATDAVSVACTNAATSAASTNAQVWDRDRDAAAVALMTSASGELFFDRAGLLVARNSPRLTSAPVWTVDAGQNGVLVSADRARDRARTYSVVVAIGTATDGTTPLAPQIAYDDDPLSPTYYLGPFGIVPYFYASPLLTTTGQALAAAKTILAKVTGMAAQLSIENAVNPALDPGDTISVVLPSQNEARRFTHVAIGDLFTDIFSDTWRGREVFTAVSFPATVEAHLIDTVTIPMDVGTPQKITTRSTRPEGDVPA